MIAQVPDQDGPTIVWDKFASTLSELFKDYVSKSPQGHYFQQVSVFTTGGNLGFEGIHGTDYGAPDVNLLSLVRGQSLHIGESLSARLAIFLPLFAWQYNVAKRSLILGHWQEMSDESDGDKPVGATLQNIVLERNRNLVQSFVTGTAVGARLTKKFQEVVQQAAEEISKKRKVFEDVYQDPRASPKRAKRGSILDKTGTPYYMTRSRVRRPSGEREGTLSSDQSDSSNAKTSQEGIGSGASMAGSFEDFRTRYIALKQFLKAFLDEDLLRMAVSGSPFGEGQLKDSRAKLQSEVRDKVIALTHGVEGQDSPTDESLEKSLDEYISRQFDAEEGVSDYAVLLTSLAEFYPLL